MRVLGRDVEGCNAATMGQRVRRSVATLGRGSNLGSKESDGHGQRSAWGSPEMSLDIGESASRREQIVPVAAVATIRNVFVLE